MTVDPALYNYHSIPERVTYNPSRNTFTFTCLCGVEVVATIPEDHYSYVATVEALIEVTLSRALDQHIEDSVIKVVDLTKYVVYQPSLHEGHGGEVIAKFSKRGQAEYFASGVSDPYESELYVIPLERVRFIEPDPDHFN